VKALTPVSLNKAKRAVAASKQGAGVVKSWTRKIRKGSEAANKKDSAEITGEIADFFNAAQQPHREFKT